MRNFEYLGNSFQLQLINQLIEDREFSNSIIDVMDDTLFDNAYFKLIVQLLKEYHKKYDNPPTFDTMEHMLKSEVTNETMVRVALDTLDKIRKVSSNGILYVKEKATKFCKQQALQKAMNLAQKIIANGDFESYDKVELLVRDALRVGTLETGQTDVFEMPDDVVSKDFRHPIPCGITGIDGLLNGGLAKTEIGVILAPTGVGKTTILTKISNHAFNCGYNVLQIFFEDNPNVIKRKHYTLWSGVPQNELHTHKEEVLAKIAQIKEKSINRIILKKIPSKSMTMSQIRNYIRKVIAEGNRIDLIVLDYIDCILPESGSKEDWTSQGSIMRSFESMCGEFNIAGWTATQGNRSSISSDVVTTDQMGGSIEKAQVGHVILTIAKSLAQKEMNLATMALVKSRVGQDGVVFENCKFNNATLEIDTDNITTFLGHDEREHENKKKRVQEILEKRKNRELTEG